MALLAAGLVAVAVWLAGPAARPIPGPVSRSVSRSVPRPARIVAPWRTRSSSARQATLDADVVAVLAERMAALLRSGLGEDQAWRALAERDDVVAALARTVVGTRSLGGDTGEALRRARGRPGGRARELAWLALAWEVSQTCGAPLAGVLEGIAVTIRAEADAARARESVMAGPRTTATVLGWLPLAGLGLGLALGADVIEVLLTTPAGRVCLLLGAGLWWAGRAWTSRLLHRAASVQA